jgi:hypothetical protein
MAILFDRDFGRVWSDGATPYIFSSVVRVPEKECLYELVEKQLELIREMQRKFGSVYSIIDLHLCPPASQQLVNEYVMEIIPRQFKAGLKFKAIVKPGDKNSEKQLAMALARIGPLPIRVHATFEEALQFINEMHTKKTGAAAKSKRYRVLGFEFGMP